MQNRIEQEPAIEPQAALAALALSERLLDRMIDQQRTKVLKLAREAIPHISADDVMNPNDYPELKAHPTFDYEDGILAGLISAQIALRAELRSRFMPAHPLER